MANRKLSEEQLVHLVEKALLPRHVAIIMDGNGRWAEKKGLPRISGHHEGILSVREIVTTSRDIGIKVLTMYAFSLENWHRPQDEISDLMELLRQYLKLELPTMMENGIQFRTIGRIERLPWGVLEQINETEAATRDNKEMVLAIALSYSGRTEMVDAVRKMVEACEQGKLKPEDIDENCFGRYLSTADLPDPDLMIRTSGESRISNFLLWQVAYTELYFTKTPWPDFRSRDFLQALYEYQNRERRFGRLRGQRRKPIKVGKN